MPYRRPRIEQVSYEHEDARHLIDRLQAVYVERYGGPDEDDPLSAEMFTPPAGAFCVCYVDDLPVVCGGWRRIDELGPRTVEVKRLHVVHEWSRRGLARQLLVHLEHDAGTYGYDRVVLLTGPRQPEAAALYRSSGYTDIAPYGWYADRPEEQITFLGKRLMPSAAR